MSPNAQFLELHNAAHNNAVELLSEAELLFQNRKHIRAYFLAFTALEEIAKSQLAADVYTGFIEEKEFWDHYLSHKKKIFRMAWATEDAKRYLDVEEEKYLDVTQPTTAGRMKALYTEIQGEKIQRPEDGITYDEAQALIHTVRVALERIMEMMEYWGHQIGTKGFLK